MGMIPFRAVMVAALCLSSLAHAGELKGSFTGTAINATAGVFSASPGTPFNGTPITGTFDLIGTTAVISNPDPANYLAFFTAGESKLTFNLLGSPFAGTYSFDLIESPLTPSLGFLRSTSGVQTVSIFSQRIPGDDYTDGGLNLVGSGLFNLADPTALQPGSIDLAASQTPFAFDERFTFSSGIQLTSVSFDTSVPEPGSLALLFAGVLAVSFRLRGI